MMDDLRLLEHQRCRFQQRRNVVFATLVAVLTLGAVGNSDYADALDTWAEEKLARVERARGQERGRIWSAKCERQGKRVLAMQADGGKWLVRCVRADLKV